MKKLGVLVVLLCVCLTLAAQQITVKGTVISADDGSTLPGVSVMIRGTTNGTITDIEGKYSLNVAADATLLFSFVGMNTEEVAVDNRSVVNVTMHQVTHEIDEIVVTALGVKKSEKSIGYSVSQVSADDVIRSGESNAVQGLAAKATGVQVISTSGTPGASSKIILRGPATFSGDNQPLIVIDGVPIDNGVNYFAAGDYPYNNTLEGVQTSNRAIDLNPEDIESVTILKGPAAAAIYGQDAGNGAVIYTTKRGTGQKGLGITFSSSLELSKVSKLPEIQTRYGQGGDGKYSGSTPNSWGEDLQATGKPVYDNIGNFFKTGHSYINNLSIVGGNSTTSFRVSVNATNMDGVVPESGMDRYAVRLTADTKLSTFLTVGGTMNYTNTKSSLVQNGSNLSGIMLPLMRMPVDFDAQNYIDKETGDQISYYSAYDNPFFSTKYNPYKEATDRLMGNVFADIKIGKIFSISWKTGVDTYNTLATQIYSYYSNGSDYGYGSGQKNVSKYAYRNVYSDLLLKFNASFGADKSFTINGLLGGNYNYKQGLRSFERGRLMTVPDFYGFSNFQDLYVSDRDWYTSSKAMFLDVTFDYKSIVFLSLTGREEWSSTFGKGSKGFFYPKVDVAYVFSHWLNDDEILSFGKIRAAYANVGISPGVYNDKMYFTTPFVTDGMTNGWGFPYMGQAGYAVSNVLSGFDLRPERNIGREIGLELKFLKGRIGFDGTFYNQLSKDLLISQPVAPTSGFSYKYVNIGEIENRGVEISLSGVPVETKDFNWNIAVNWSKNVSEVKKLAPGVDELAVGSGFVTPQSYAIVGEPYGVFYGAKFKRDNGGNLLINPASGLPIQEDTYKSLGNPNPDWMMNINNEFTYKGFAFSFLIDIRHGGDLWNGTWSNLNLRGKSKESGDRDHEYVIPGVYASGDNAGQANTVSIPASSYFGSNYLGLSGSEIDIQDGSWVRLRAVNLSYRFDLAKTNVIQYLELGVTLRNMLLFTKYKGVDPETSLTGAGENLMGYDYFNNPGTKSALFNLKIAF